MHLRGLSQCPSPIIGPSVTSSLSDSVDATASANGLAHEVGGKRDSGSRRELTPSPIYASPEAIQIGHIHLPLGRSQWFHK